MLDLNTEIYNLFGLVVLLIASIDIKTEYGNDTDTQQIVWIEYCCSVVKLCPTLCDPMDCSTPGFLVLHYLLEFAQIHVH